MLKASTERSKEMKRTIFLDMDETIAALYDIPNWLDKLRHYDPSPYIEAEVMWNMSLLARYLNKLQAMGYKIGIISWLAKDSTYEYDQAVRQAKEEWLHTHLRSVEFDYIYITSYGFPKENFATLPTDILFDDNVQIREDWGCEAYSPNEILSTLRALT
jgi:hypothetical protein